MTIVDTGTAESARAILNSELSSWGLGALADQLWSRYLTGTPIQQVLLDVRNTPEYKQRFPAMADLQAQGRAITEAEYISNERAYAQVAQAMGLPKNFYDTPDDFAANIRNNVSPKEFADRLGEWQQYADQIAADPSNATVLGEMSRLYGITPDSGSFLAYVTDPERALPAIQNQINAAALSARARNVGFGGLSRQEAEMLNAQGVTDQQAQQGFSTLAADRELFNPLNPGETAISRQDQLAAAFAGNAQAQERIQRRARERAAMFSDGGGFASGRAGVGTTGLGSANN